MASNAWVQTDEAIFPSGHSATRRSKGLLHTLCGWDGLLLQQSSEISASEQFQWATKCSQTSSVYRKLDN